MNSPSRSWLGRAALVAIAAVAGCASAPRNAPLTRFDPTAGYRVNNVLRDDKAKETFVILAFSGGGTRAAALSYGVLEKLRKTPIANGRRLLDEVDLISSISGGSFTAAYYALNGEDTFKTFESRFLEKDVQGALFWRLFNPVNWCRLASSTFNRIDMAAEYYDEEVFGGATFGQLLGRSGRPFAMINATDMSLGARFEFTQNQFDLLSSDLSPFPIARAVAASSAFPVLLSPLRLVNYPATRDFALPEWIKNGLQDRQTAPAEHRRAQVAVSYADQDGDAKRRPFVHLMDGGIADNIGLRGPLAATEQTRGSDWSLLQDINNGIVKRVVVIAVDAKTEPATDWDQSEASPSWSDGLMAAATQPMDNFSSETIQTMQELFKAMRRDAKSMADTEKLIRAKYDPTFSLPPIAAVDFHFVHLSFDDIADLDRRREFQNMPTSFSLESSQVAKLRAVAGELLDQSKVFGEVVKALEKP